MHPLTRARRGPTINDTLDSPITPGTTPLGERPRLFVVFGMPRTGTTYLYHALPKHPDIFVPYRKESHYFSVNYCKGEAWFRGLYADMAPHQIGADINPMYYLDALTVDRLLAFDPEVRIVLGVREPVDFVCSLYGNMQAHGLEVPPITDMVQGYDWPVTPHTSLPFTLANGFMRRRIGELQARFGARLLMYDFRYFDRSPLPVLQAIEAFLGLSPWFTDGNLDKVRINATGRRNPIGLNALLANQRVLDLLYACLPRPMIRYARTQYERISARPAAPGRQAGDETLTAIERGTLERVFAEDLEFYRALFARTPIVTAAAAPATADGLSAR